MLISLADVLQGVACYLVAAWLMFHWIQRQRPGITTGRVVFLSACWPGLLLFLIAVAAGRASRR